MSVMMADVAPWLSAVCSMTHTKLEKNHQQWASSLTSGLIEQILQSFNLISSVLFIKIHIKCSEPEILISHEFNLTVSQCFL